MNPLFSILVVCLNPGDKLNKTLDSILSQTFLDYEILIKDGGSKDGSLQRIAPNEKIRIVQKADTGIYDAMNQAVEASFGKYILFLNCGDLFYDKNVLEQVAVYIGKQGNRGIYYGDTYCEKTGHVDLAAREITPLICYRNIPCHQACFYQRELLTEHPYIPEYKIRADYEHFLWCFFSKKIKPAYTGITVASYEGNGFSESKANKKRDKKEHGMITKTYMSVPQLFLCKAYLVVTLVPVRRAMAESKTFAGIYQKIKAVFRR